jgi:hypothetical protein
MIKIKYCGHTLCKDFKYSLNTFAFPIVLTKFSNELLIVFLCWQYSIEWER